MFNTIKRIGRNLINDYIDTVRSADDPEEYMLFYILTAIGIAAVIGLVCLAIYAPWQVAICIILVVVIPAILMICVKYSVEPKPNSSNYF